LSLKIFKSIKAKIANAVIKNGIISIIWRISIVLLIFSFWFFRSSKLFWEFVEYIGAGIVTLGVIGEYLKEFKEFPKDVEKRKKFAEWSVIVLIFGLVIELLGLVRTTQLSGDEIVSLETTNVQISLTVEKLRKQNDEFEAKAKDRRITMEKMNNFIFLTEKIKKIPIKICIFAEGRDTETFAKDLREMFTNAHFETNSDAGVWGINREPTKIAATKFGVTNEPKSLVFFSYSTNEIVNIKGYALEKTNGFERPIITENNEETIYHGIEDCLQQIGITTDWEGDPYFVEPGKCEIVIRVK
jgi:hypothetical protein